MDFKKEKSYYQHIRSDLLALLPKNSQIERVLDIGCGDGSTGNFLKHEFGAT